MKQICIMNPIQPLQNSLDKILKFHVFEKHFWGKMTAVAFHIILC